MSSCSSSLASWVLGLAALSIEHVPPDCVVRGTASRLVARVTPPAEVASMHLELQSGDASTVCVLEMKSDAPSFAVALPPPGGHASEIRYSIVAVDRAGAPSRSGPFVARIVAEKAACSGTLAPAAAKGAVPTCPAAAGASPPTATPAPAPTRGAPAAGGKKGRGPAIGPVATCLTVHGQRRVAAPITPGDDVAEARVYFGANRGAELCYVEMRRTGDVFSGLLPKREEADAAGPPFYVSARDRFGKEGRTAALRGSDGDACVPADDPSTAVPFVPIVCPGGAFR